MSNAVGKKEDVGLVSCHKLRLNQPVYLIVHNDDVLQMDVKVQADRHQTQKLDHDPH